MLLYLRCLPMVDRHVFLRSYMHLDAPKTLGANTVWALFYQLTPEVLCSVSANNDVTGPGGGKLGT